MSHAIPLLHDFLIDSAARLPEKVALVCQGQRVTYAELDRQSNAVAHALRTHGVERGDRVIVFADNTVAAVVSFFAVLKANAVVSMVNPQTKDDKLAYLLNDCRAAAMITDAHLATPAHAAAAQSTHLQVVIVTGNVAGTALASDARVRSWDDAIAAQSADAPPPRTSIDIDLASIIYTSGSTGDPKGVMLTHRNMLAAATSVSTYLGMVEDDIVMALLPLSFDYGLYQMIMSFRVGARLILERSFTYPAEVLNRVVQEKVTGFPGVPTIFAILGGLRNLDQYDFSNIRYVTNTAAALSRKNIEMIRNTFPAAKLFSMYGLTECKRCTYLPPEDLDRKTLSVGIAIPNTELWIVNERDERVGPDEVGQLVIRGATVMRGYWEKPAETAKKLRPGPLPGEMVLYTGDYCKLDSDGYLYFVGRMDDIIKSRGEKVAPKEVENAIVDIPGVREAAVIGVPDDVLGEAVKAIVVLDEGASVTEREILSHCSRRLENFMVPKYVDIVAALPMTTTGKIKKTDLT
jgi:amino acid adenylation domain-containing protein